MFRLASPSLSDDAAEEPSQVASNNPFEKRFSLSASFLGLLLWLAALLPAGAYSGLVVFGDSLSDRGNTIDLVGYGAVISVFSNYDNTYYNSAYNSYGIAAEGRWSSGPTWVEYLYGNLLSSSTGATPIDLGRNSGRDLTSATNFAWAGSTTASGYKTLGVSPFTYDLANLQTQVANYIAISANPLQPDIGSALYSVWSGGNDANRISYKSLSVLEIRNNSPLLFNGAGLANLGQLLLK